MKRLLILLILLSSTVVTAPLVEEEIRNTIPLEEVVIQGYSHRNMTDYLDVIGFRESSNRYHVINRLGYMGKYQFGMSTLKTIGIKTSRTNFINNPGLQELAMLKNLKYNKKVLQEYIDKHHNSLLDTIRITESGILAAAHIGGANGVKRYFDENRDKHDANGTRISDYLTEFSGYKLKQIQ